jgi:hypothetical protein
VWFERVGQLQVISSGYFQWAMALPRARLFRYIASQKPPADHRNCREKNRAENQVLISSVYGGAQRESVS